MAFAAFVRKSRCSMVPLSIRSVRGSSRNHLSALFSAVNHHANGFTPKPAVFQYSTAVSSKNPSSSEFLLRIIDSEIKLAQESDDHDRDEYIPEGFPFKIEDNAGEQTVTLIREYEGELVKVEVHMTDLVTGEDNAADDDDDDDDSDDIPKPTRSSIPLIVSVSKKSGHSLEFHCIAFPDKIEIDNLSAKSPEISEDKVPYEGPHFHDLEEKLKKSFHKYLEMRGIKPSTINFLHEYMINKDSREFLGWLHNLKKFIQA